MAKFWQAMALTNGAIWTNQFGNVGGPSFQAWMQVCSDLTPEQILDGMNKCLSDSELRLTASKFRAICQCKVYNPHNSAAYKIFKKESLLMSDQDRKKSDDARKKAMENIKKLLS